MPEGVDLIGALLGGGFGWGFHDVKAQYLLFALTNCLY
jgi:hypothetical protein